jgi:GNAT superfamily N-acetyltransferase
LNTQVLSINELINWVDANIPHGPMRGILFAGDRLSCCDEAVALKVDGRIVGLATIAPKGEYGAGGQPTIIALYVVLGERRKGYGKILQEAVVTRFIERGFQNIRVDVMSSYAMRTINSLPQHLRDALDVRDLGDSMDLISSMEGES